jgi:phage gp29-like protein
MPYQERPSGLLVPSADAIRARPVMRELAPISGGLDITRGLVDSLPLLDPQDSLRSRSSGPHHLDLYAEVLDDWQVWSALQARRNAVCATEWEVIPGGGKRRDKAAADLIQSIVDGIAWDQITAQMWMGICHGCAYGEILWQRDGAHVVPGDIRVRDPRRFAWRPDGTLVLLTVTDSFYGEPMPDRKFWAYSTGPVHGDDPYGIGLAHWCYWPVQFKRGSVKLMLTALDKYASPTAMGHFPASATPAEKTKLLRALEAIRSQAALILPEGMTAELLAASRSGSADYLGALQYWDAAISKLIGGHSATQDATPGRLGGEDMGRDVRSDLVTADADLLNASANRTWVRWVTEWSYPGAALPTLWRRMEEDDDLGQRAERERKIFDIGYRPTLAQIVDTYGGEWEPVAAAAPAGPPAGDAPEARADSDGDQSEDDDDAETPPPAPTGGLADRLRAALRAALSAAPTTDLAAGEPALDAQDQIDAAGDTDPGYQEAMDAMLAPILQALEQGLTPEEILARMDEWYADLDDTALTDLLTRGIAASDAIGRIEQDQEAAP